MHRAKTNKTNVFAMITLSVFACIIISWIPGSNTDIGFTVLSAILLAFFSVALIVTKDGFKATRRMYLNASAWTQMFKDSSIIMFVALLLTWVSGFWFMHWTIGSLLMAMTVYFITQVFLVTLIKKTTVVKITETCRAK
jgi:hypothetical protein